MAVLNSAEFKKLPPSQLVPRLVDQGRYVASECLGVAASRSRPSVSNDNPYSASLFRTLKYRPELPVKPFENLLQARRWATELVHRYSDKHRHSAIGFVTPSQRHAGQDLALLADRVTLYERARQTNPTRGSKQTRKWRHVDQVNLNPDTPQLKESSTLKNAASFDTFTRQLP